jgi:hypothetical protein
MPPCRPRTWTRSPGELGQYVKLKTGFAQRRKDAGTDPAGSLRLRVSVRNPLGMSAAEIRTQARASQGTPLRGNQTTARANATYWVTWLVSVIRRTRSPTDLLLLAHRFGSDNALVSATFTDTLMSRR